jgi:NAD(P)H-dependent flavin oxidoreductase YrpB (nitropropane dioxygenase family)
VQVGTLFAFCNESGIPSELKTRILTALNQGEVDVVTDALASPTDYPFKLLRMQDDPDESRRLTRTRVCDLGYLRTAIMEASGKIVYRCAAEPIEHFAAKGGDIAKTKGRRCLCNGLLSTVGYAQWRGEEGREPPLITSGAELADLRALLAGRCAYSAAEAVDWIVGR